MPEFTRPRHHQVWKALESFDAGFLNSARCYFGGGTRIVLELAEYRESADVDFSARTVQVTESYAIP